MELLDPLLEMRSLLVELGSLLALRLPLLVGLGSLLLDLLEDFEEALDRELLDLD